MYYIIHLAPPIFYAIFYVCFTHSSEPITEMFSSLPTTYLVFSFPYWIWASISAYFEASKQIVIGAFIALHLLWLAVAILVISNSGQESGNGWLLYAVGSPIAIFIGAYLGKFMPVSNESA